MKDHYGSNYTESAIDTIKFTFIPTVYEYFDECKAPITIDKIEQLEDDGSQQYVVYLIDENKQTFELNIRIQFKDDKINFIEALSMSKS